MNTTDHLREQASALAARTHARHADITRISKPVDPFGSSQLDLFDGPPRSARSDQLGFAQTVDRLGQRVVIGLTG
jgi:hypothetical protein